jgi:hypothetical protein
MSCDAGADPSVVTQLALIVMLLVKAFDLMSLSATTLTCWLALGVCAARVAALGLRLGVSVS